MKRHVMVDLETLGLKPGCPIVSIGAVVFMNAPEFRDNLFYCTIAPESQYDIMDSADQSTLNWWNKQSEEAKAEVFNNPNSIDIVAALHRFRSFLEQLQVTSQDEIVIWGNGASFDEPILLEAFTRTLVAIQWNYRNSFCFRTLKMLAEMYNIELPTFEGIKHNALADARYQAQCALRVFNTLDHFAESSLK